MGQIDDILSVAARYIGIKESPPNSNNVVFNTRYYGKPVSGPEVPWCCAFIWCLFQDIGVPELFYGSGKTASCTTLLDYAKSRGQFHVSGFKRGDLVLFNWSGKPYPAQHIGMIEEVKNGSIVTIEGNTGIGDDSNGGEVMRRTRSTNIIGVYRPQYRKDKDVFTQEEFKKFNEMMEVYLKTRAALSGSSSLKPEFEAAKSMAITDGSRPKDFATREEVAVMVLRGNK